MKRRAMSKYWMSKYCLVVLGLALGASQVHASYIPFGLQANVSQATLNSWGWTEIHRSSGFYTASEAAIVAAATGQYLMMGVYNRQTQMYEILGAGLTSTVTAITYNDQSSDNNGNYNPNWSNGLNFYRTATVGSWGFTTNSVTDLWSVDYFLNNGLQSTNGNTEGVLSKGLSFYTWNGYLQAGWEFNVTGNNHQYIVSNRERVFFTANASNPVPAPAAIVLFGIGLVGLAGFRNPRRKMTSIAIT